MRFDDGYGFPVVNEAARNAPNDAVVVAVRHRVFRSIFPLEVITPLLVRERPLLIDVKAFYDGAAARAAGLLLLAAVTLNSIKRGAIRSQDFRCGACAESLD